MVIYLLIFRLKNYKKDFIMLINFYSTIGGSGKTILSINFSLLCSKKGYRTLLIDMSTICGIYPYLMGQNNSENNFEIIQKNISNYSLENFNDRLINIINENLFIIQNNSLLTSLKTKLNNIEKLINFAKESFDIIVIDTSVELNKKNLFLFEKSDYNIMPITQDISHIWNTIQFKEILEVNKINMKIIPLINKYQKNVLDQKAIEEKIGLNVITTIPFYSYNFQKYLNQCKMIDYKFNNTAYKDFNNLTDLILKEIKII
jgi:flagellar biosynthesis protein FlhG